MAAEILLRPGNRSLDHSTTDFSNYGAQPTTTVQFAPDTVSDGAIPPPSSEQSAAVEPSQPTALAPEAGALTPASETDTAAGGTSDAADQLADGDTASSSFQDSAINLSPLVPSPMGSSSPVSIGVDTVAREGIEAGRTTVDDVRAAADDTQGGVSNVVAGVEGLLDAQALTATTATIVANTVESTLQALEGTVTSTLDGLGGAVSGTANAATTELNDAVTGAVSGVETTAELGLGAVDATAAAAAPVEALAGPVAGTVDAVADTEVDLGQLAGSDPAAGVATLVDLVAADNMFDLRDAGAPPEAEAASSPIDQLIGEAPESSPLLGDAAHHDDDASDLPGGALHDDFGI